MLPATSRNQSPSVVENSWPSNCQKLGALPVLQVTVTVVFAVLVTLPTQMLPAVLERVPVYVGVSCVHVALLLDRPTTVGLVASLVIAATTIRLPIPIGVKLTGVVSQVNGEPTGVNVMPGPAA